MDISHYIQSKGTLINAHLEKLIPEFDTPYNQLFQAARYSLLGKGKRIRPLLALATHEAFGGKQEIALTPICALEMIHAYSMIHDDLPCMDNDDFRRGKPTLHKVFPESHALLAGDYLLTKAFDILAHAPAISSDQKVQLIAILARRAGSEGMIAGQVMDIEAENQEIDLQRLRYIHRYKTGALLTASIEFGGILAKATEEQMQHLRRFGDDIGLAFQIIDDILDVTASQAKHGKAVASDVINKKATYVTLLGLEKSQHTALNLLHSSKESLKQLTVDTSILSDIAEMIVYRTN